MVKVSQITVSEHSFDQQFKKPDDATKQCLALLPAKDILNLLPRKTRYTLRFHLEDANSQLANAIRRCLEDELFTLSMTFNILHDSDGKPADFIHDLQTNDKEIFGKCDELKKRIEAIPIRQDIDPSEWKISLSASNPGGDIDLLDIKSSDFKLTHKGKLVPADTLMYPNYILMRLRPKRQLNISNIRIVGGIGRTNANSFKYITNIFYEIDEKPLTKVNGKFVGKSSMESNYKKFNIGYSTYRNGIHIYDPIKSSCKVLVVRLQNILVEWEKISKGTAETSDKILVNKVADSYTITIENEGYTIANMLSYYIFREMPATEFSSGGIKHLDKEGAIIIIKNKDYLTIFANAAKAAVKDLQAIDAAFTQK
jgi:DNA-directed RNA polymerase subunit L